MRRWLSVIGALLLCLIACGNKNREVPISESRILMDTLVRISVFNTKHSSKHVKEILDLAFKEMALIESRTSVHADSSDIYRIEREAGQKAVPVFPDTYRILMEAQRISTRTGGAFDVTIGGIKEIWKFDSAHPEVPERDLLQTRLSNVDYQSICLEDSHVYLSHRGVHLDLGGVAKGYIIDRGVAILQEKGIRAGIVDAGGDMRIFGNHPDRDRWRVGIQHPRGLRGELLAELHISETCIATSGDYERFFEQDGIRYHHILDPKTGLPVRECVSVTIVTESAIRADAFATAVFVMGPKKGLDFIEEDPSLEGVIVFEEEGRLLHVVSKGLQQELFFH